MDLTPKYYIKASEAKLHLATGNNKIGRILNFSTLPGNADHLLMARGILLTDVPGTCSKHCDECFSHGCYAVNSARLHHNAVIRAWAENTLLLRNDPERLFDEIDAVITKKNEKFIKTGDPADKKVELFRINVSGEIESVDELRRWDMLAKEHPEVNFGIYTKNIEAVEAFLRAYGETAPNFAINISEWHGVAKAFIDAHPGQFNVFEYDDSNLKSCTLEDAEKERLSKVPHCPAVDKQGHHTTRPDGSTIKCEDCRRCYKKTGARTAVWSH